MPRPSPSSAPELHGEQQGQLIVCEFCGRKFSSGQAWGGHKRHHLKVLKGSRSKMTLSPLEQGGRVKEEDICKLMKEEENKPGSCIKTIKAGDVSVSSGGRPTCCLCGKDFPSMNSLFGHMRLHPARGWKGTKPQSKPNCNAEKKNSSSCSSGAIVSGAMGSSDVDDEICSNATSKIGVDLTASLSSGWSKKDRRGRVGSFNYSVPEAAQNLMNLSRDPSRFSGISRMVEELVDSGSERSRSSKKMKKLDQESERGNLRVACDLKNNVKRGYGKVLSDLESDRPKVDKEEVIKKLKKRLNVRKKKKMNEGGKLDDRDQGVPGIDSYRAKRKFLSPASQALGGSSGPGKSKAGELLEDTFSLPQEKAADLVPTSLEAYEHDEDAQLAMEATFQGQALGEHKRCHWKATAPEDSTPSGEANHGASGKKVTKISHKRLDFDLNEPYMMSDA